MIFVDTSSDSSISIVTGLDVEDLGITFRVPARTDTLLFSEAIRPAHKFTYPLIHKVAGALSWRGKWQGVWANHSRPSRADIKSEWRYSATPPPCHHDIRRENL